MNASVLWDIVPNPYIKNDCSLAAFCYVEGSHVTRFKTKTKAVKVDLLDF